LTGAGGPSAISVWKSLRGGHEMHMADMDARAAGLYLVDEDRRMLLPRGDDPRLVPLLIEACRDRGIHLLIPTVDAELAPLAEAATDFAALGVRVALSPVACLRLCRDKYELLTRLAPSVPVPDTHLLTKEVAARTTVFPRFAKPRFGAGSTGIAVIPGPAELAALPMDGSYLLQELLPGEEYSVDVYVRGDGAVSAAVPRERMKTDSGIAVTARTVHLPDVIDVAVRAARAAGVRYVANVQFKRATDGLFKLLEINPRFPGTLPLTTAAGVDLPAMLVEEISGRPPPDGIAPFKELMVVRYWTEQFVDPDEWRRLCPR
jgi:carbamoyl-phosphate synthase large subunit